MNFISKKILFISINTFDYEKHILNKLIEMGAKVDYFDERPSNSILAKGLIRLNKYFFSIKINRYYSNILEEIGGKQYDFLFVIKGEVVPVSFIEHFKLLNPSCKLLYYTWDSFANNPNGFKLLPFFDKNFTFDKTDSIKYQLNFRPLFFINQYGELRDELETANPPQCLLFIGTAHSDRYRISQNLVKWCERNNINVITYYFIQGLFVFIFKWIFDKSFSGFRYKFLHNKQLSVNEVVDLYKKATVILDINHPGQSGLTMRTFEALGAGKKLITTNQNIKNYPFYNENNILVINRTQSEFSKNFFLRPYKFYGEEMYSKLSIEGWLNEIFFSPNNNFWDNL